MIHTNITFIHSSSAKILQALQVFLYQEKSILICTQINKDEATMNYSNMYVRQV